MDEAKDIYEKTIAEASAVLYKAKVEAWAIYNMADAGAVYNQAVAVYNQAVADASDIYEKAEAKIVAGYNKADAWGIYGKAEPDAIAVFDKPIADAEKARPWVAKERSNHQKSDILASAEVVRTKYLARTAEAKVKVEAEVEARAWIRSMNPDIKGAWAKVQAAETAEAKAKDVWVNAPKWLGRDAWNEAEAASNLVRSCRAKAQAAEAIAISSFLWAQNKADAAKVEAAKAKATKAEKIKGAKASKVAEAKCRAASYLAWTEAKAKVENEAENEAKRRAASYLARDEAEITETKRKAASYLAWIEAEKQDKS